MVRFWCILVLIVVWSPLSAQQFSMSVGVNTGIMSTRTIDDGIDRDPRYKQYYNVKFSPIGVNLGVNYEFIGFVVSPGLINVGQNAYVVNNSGGQDGKRKIDLKYLNVPVAFKVHLVNLAFLKISGVASLSAAYLISGKETISHGAMKMDFPKEVYPILPSNYIVQYDGIAAPAVTDFVIAEKKDFRPLQVYAAAGFQSDWDISNNWRVIFDLRINYGIFDPRTSDYIAKVDNRQTLYDMPGERHDLFAQLSVGIARYIEFEKSDQDKKKRLRRDQKGYKPIKYPYRRVQVSKPK